MINYIHNFLAHQQCVLDIHTLFIVKKKPVTKELAFKFVSYYYKLEIAPAVGCANAIPLFALLVVIVLETVPLTLST